MTISRRRFVAGAAAGAAGVLSGRLAAEEAAKGEPDLPLVDYHVHLDELGLEKALEVSRAKGVKFGLVEHAGTKENKYPVVLSSDADLAGWIDRLDGKPCYKGVQAEFLDWMTCFSKEVVARLDYVLTDALTFPEKDGTRVELWKAEKVRITDPQDFMERYVAHHVRILTTEPVDILANVTFLPAVLARQHDELWTEERMKRIIDAAVRSNVAIEINAGGLPREPFLRLAKAAGAKFSFGSNGRKADVVGKLDPCVRMARRLGLTRADLFSPAPPGKKPIEVRREQGTGTRSGERQS